MAELADAHDSGSCVQYALAGSSPVSRTSKPLDDSGGFALFWRHHTPTGFCGLPRSASAGSRDGANDLPGSVHADQEAAAIPWGRRLFPFSGTPSSGGGAERLAPWPEHETPSLTSAHPPAAPSARIFPAAPACWCSSGRSDSSRRSAPFHPPSGRSRTGSGCPGCVQGSSSRE